jgi:hypothetical protein
MGLAALRTAILVPWGHTSFARFVRARPRVRADAKVDLAYCLVSIKPQVLGAVSSMQDELGGWWVSSGAGDPEMATVEGLTRDLVHGVWCVLSTVIPVTETHGPATRLNCTAQPLV